MTLHPKVLLAAILFCGPSLSAPAQQPHGVTPARAVIHLEECGPIDGLHDAATLAAAYARIEAQLAAGEAAALVFPPGRLVIAGSPELHVPAGANLALIGQATEIDVADGGAGLQIRVGNDPSKPETRLRAAGFQFVNTAPNSGGSAIAIYGGPFSQQTRPTLSDITCRNAAPQARGWTNCIFAVDISLGVFSDIQGFFPNSFGSPADGTLIRLGATNASTADRSAATVDNKFTGVSLSGGFAGIWPSGHVEGIYIANSSFVGSAYGVYWGKNSPADWGLYLALVNSHVNAQLRGIYTNGVFDVMVTSNLFYQPFGDRTPPPDALLPADNTQWATTGVNWAAIDIQNAGNTTVNGNQIYGAHAGRNAFAGVVIDTGTSYQDGTSRPSTIVGNSITGTNSYPIWLADSVRNTLVSGNAMIVTPPIHLPPGLPGGENMRDGQLIQGPLPTTDPHTPGALWLRGSSLQISPGH